MILKPGEREAIKAWWAESQVCKGFVMGMFAAVVGIGGGFILSTAICAFFIVN